MTEEERIARGKTFFEKCYGGVVPLPKDIEPGTYWGHSMKMFNDFWGDERLAFRDKRMLVLGVLAGLGADPSTFETHAKCALQNGELSVDELRSVILMLIPYVGHPRTSRLHVTIENLIAAHEGS